MSLKLIVSAAGAGFVAVVVFLVPGLSQASQAVAVRQLAYVLPYLAVGLLILLGGSLLARGYFTPRKSSQLLHHIFEKQADDRPGTVAVVFGPVVATYADIESRANRLARYLQRKGVGRGAIVAMLLPRSVDAYATILGILKAGAAYVPVDPAYPAERVAYILRDSGAKVLVTTEELAPYVSFTGPVIRVDGDDVAISTMSSARPTSVHVEPRDLCYVIYTSGSTGRPKGVMVEHRNVSHLVRAESQIYKVQPEDRVYQGASLSFDLSVEEIWLAFNAGATLVAATPEMARAGPDLSKLLTESNVTVLSCVPTLLSILGESVPSLRLLILGGEACPRELVERWSRPGLRMVNTYGPTETTVIATHVDLSPDKKVTIGRPVPGYRVHILGENLQPVPAGGAGEICIGGVGVARGYMGLPEKTRTRFVPDPFAPSDEPDARLYRTGDLGRFDEEGNIEFLGRADGQVKLRGFRIELSEIETVLMQADGVLGAACAMREDTPGLQQLVGYVVPRPDARVHEERLLSHLRSRLPPYMVPSIVELVAELPMLPSGKLDRASLPPPSPRKEMSSNLARRARTETERRLLEVWGALFHPLPVSADDDFFLDLGGHSLLAARMVSELRKDSRFARASVSDVYEHPSLASLASHLDSDPRHDPSGFGSSQESTRHGDRPGDGRRHLLAGVLQGLGLIFIFGTRCLGWVTPYLVFFILLESGASILESAAWAIVSDLAVIPALLVIAVSAKWLVLGRVKPGRYRLWGGYYLRWWFAQSVVRVLPLRQLTGTPLLSAVYRLLGARIGKNVYLGTDRLGAYDLISIGDGSSIDELVTVGGYSVENGILSIGPVTIGRGCFVGTWSVLGEYSVMEDGARLEDLSMLHRGARVPRGETWAGSPARYMNRSIRITPPPSQSRIRNLATNILYATIIPIFSVIFFLGILPGMLFLARFRLLLDPVPYLLAASLVGASFVLLFAISVVLMKWLLLGRVRAGTYPLHGGFYVRYWFIDQLLKLSLEVMGQIYATLYLARWYRALGAKVGRFVELSTAASTTPDLLELGDGSTVADESSLGAPRVEGGWITLAPTRLGRRAFIGNSGVVSSGTQLGDESLVGVLSIAPCDQNEAGRKGVAWLGSPPILLPRRQPSALFSDNRTFTPTRRLRLARGSFEILRVTMPAIGHFLAAALVVSTALELLPVLGLITTLLLLPAIYTAAVLTTIMAVVLVKWIVIGRYKPFVRPLWNNFIWRLELVNALYEFMAAPIALEDLQGTPFLPRYLRLLGCKIGRRTYIDTTGFLEWDLVEVGDRACLMEDCIVQTHLFEDRVLKASRLRIGNDCSIGPASVVLYDSTMEDGSRLDGLSLLMKGETLPAGTAWAGIPAAWQDPSRKPAKEDSRSALSVTVRHRHSRE